jgi:hypothetical protein
VLKSKQFIAIGIIVVLVGILYSLDIKGLVKPKEGRGLKPTTQTSAVIVNEESVSETGKQALNANLASQINKLEAEIKSASNTDKLVLQKTLAQKWDDVNEPAPAAFLWEQITASEYSYKNWLTTGNHFTDAYNNYKDSTALPTFVEKAINAYSKALEINPKGLDAKSGLGAAYVTEGKNPMQGIQLLLGVVGEDPKNLIANMNLGLFSMKSGQFEKAVNRFKTVLSIKESPEVYFYLGTSYENLGENSNAIIAYTKSKELAADPGLASFVDKKIKELSK